MILSDNEDKCYICKGELQKKNLGNIKVKYCPECGAIEPLYDWVTKIKISAH
ncbi:Zn-finger nucleic acid-binding protein [Methanohalophilus levihalophilus]|nr:Zn-finger nucleic acid-binding protein [Methanohalophilus levihalophilus]